MNKKNKNKILLVGFSNERTNNSDMIRSSDMFLQKVDQKTYYAKTFSDIQLFLPRWYIFIFCRTLLGGYSDFCYIFSLARWRKM